MVSIEQKIKEQYAKIFLPRDWMLFKTVSEYYLREAVHLLKKDIDVQDPLKLLVRNAQKRLFIGVGCELLLKSYFLRHGFGINKIKRDYINEQSLSPPYKIDSLPHNKLEATRTFSFNQLQDQSSKTPLFSSLSAEDRSAIIHGLKIAKVFRNKEGHSTTLWHEFDPENYSDIEKSLTIFYRIGFNEILNIQFSIEENEEGIFEKEPSSY